jgi:hypothetical protein
VTFVGSAGGSSPLGAVSIASARNVTLAAVSAASLVQSAGSGATILGGPVTTTGPVGISTGAVTVGSGGGIAAGGTVTLATTSGILLAASITTTGDAISLAGPVTLGANSTVAATAGGSTSGAAIAFSSTINGPFALTVDAGTSGDVTFGGEIGGASPASRLASLSVTSAPATTHFVADVTTTGDQTYTGGVRIENDVTFTATHTDGDIRFLGAVNADTGAESITIDAGGNVSFGGPVGATPFAALTVDSGTNPGETIEFGAGVGTVSADSIALNTNRPVVAAAVATIVGRAGTTFVADEFAMGQGHKLTVLGDVAIGAAGGANASSVTLGDVVSLGDLRVNADSIVLLGRSAEMILTNTGSTVLDPAVDYIVDGQVFFSVTPTMGGAVPGNRAEFASASGAVDGSGTLTGFQQFIYAQPITTAVVTGPAPANAVLDLRASDTRSQQINPATVIPPGGARIYGLGSAVPDDEESKDEADGAESGDTAAP